MNNFLCVRTSLEHFSFGSHKTRHIWNYSRREATRFLNLWGAPLEFLLICAGFREKKQMLKLRFELALWTDVLVKLANTTKLFPNHHQTELPSPSSSPSTQTFFFTCQLPDILQDIYCITLLNSPAMGDAIHAIFRLLCGLTDFLFNSKLLHFIIV